MTGHLRAVISRSMPGDQPNEGPVTFVVECPNCAETTRVTVPFEGAVAWRLRGELIQVAFPELSKADRESLINGICPTCWQDIVALAYEERVVSS